jgi:replicative DNA helicase
MNFPVPQNDLDAEGTLLSACMFDPEAIDSVSPIIRPEHFYADANRRIYEAVFDLHAEGMPRDAVTVAGWLEDRQRLGQVGGTPYLAELVQQIPATVQLESTARRIVDKWRLRRIIDVARGMIAGAQTLVGGVSEFVQQCEADLFAVANDSERTVTLKTVREVIRQCVDETREARESGRPVGATTGFRSVDGKTGGLRDGSVCVVAARPGHGKTSLATQVAKARALDMTGRRGVFFASVEMPSRQIGDRFIAQEAKLDTRLVESGVMTPAQWSLYTAAATDVARLPIVIDDVPSLTLPVLRSAIRRGTRRLQQEYNQPLGLVVIDYIQLMSVVKGHERNENDRLTELSNGIKNMAKEFNCPFLLLSQLNRDVEKRPGKKPQMSDLRGSGSIEQDAHTIIFIHREDVYRGPGEQRDGSAELHITKCRGGQTGMVRLDYQDFCTRFIDSDDVDPHDQVAQQFHDFGDVDDDWRNQ